MSQILVTGEAKIRDIQGPVVANDGVVTALDGAASQYVRGDGTLADFPTSSGGGSSVSYYLNSSVSQGTIGGVAYRELSKDPIIGAGTDIAISSNGYVANYITDANDPDVVLVPGGNFNCEFYFSVNNNTGNPTTYAELYKYDGTTFTLLGTSAGVPESINQGTIIAPYYFAIPVATASLALTDRLAIRIYVNVDGRTVTLHTENGHLCQVVTTLSKGMVSLNNLTDQSQFLTTGTAGTDFNIVSSGDTHTFNIPSASATNRGLITTGIQTIAGSKTFSSAITADSGITLKEGVIPSAVGYTGLAGDADGLLITKRVSSTAYTNLLYFNSATSNTYTFPNASGTLALTSNLSSYVPYTGATASVDLGTNTLTALGVIANSFSAIGNINPSGNGGYIFLKQGIAPFTYDTGYNSITANSTRFVLIANVDASNNKSALLELGSLTNNTQRTFTLPDASGTLALTSNLSGYLPLAGGTMTGDLNIRKTSGIATIGFPNTGSELDPAFIQHVETTIDTGIMRFSVSDNDTSADYFVFGNIGGGGGAYVERFKILANGIVTLGTWNGTAIADSYISSASTWNAKQNALNGTGFVKATGTTITYDNSTYLTTSSASSTYIPYTGATASLEMGNGSLGIQAGKFILFNRAGSNTLGAGAYQGFVDAAQSNGVYFQLNTSNNLGIFGRISGADTQVGFISTSGIFSGTSFVPTGSTIPTNGMYLSAANTLDFSTNSVNRLSISSAGIITTPNQVSFKGYITANASLTKGVWNTIPYNGEEYDTQSNFSTSTYRFTAPVAGKYLFTVNFNAYNLDDTATLRLALYINSSATRFLYGFANLPTGNTGDTNISGSDILNLSAGNTVEVRVLTDGSGTFNMSQDTTYNSFSGHLL